MKESPRWYHELTQLIATLVDETITDEQRIRLNELLEHDPEARRVYLQYMHMDDSLPDVLVRQSVHAAHHLPAARNTGRMRWGWRELLAGAVLVLVTAIVVVTVTRISTADVQFVQPAIDPEAVKQLVGHGYAQNEVAVLSRVVDAQWGDATTLPTTEGAGLRPGFLSLRSGLVQIEFFSGVSVVLEGPAEFELISAMDAFCHKGRLRSFVPPPAEGFIMHTPGVDVIDWGTEFALQVNDQRESELHVISGEIELASRGTFNVPAELSHLGSGQAVRYKDTGEVSEIVADLMSFIGHVRLMEMAESSFGERYKKWLVQTEQLQSDPARILYYTFQDHKPWDRIVRNAGVDHSLLTDGAIVGCQWTEGRWPRKGALEFKRTTDRVRIYVPGEFPALSCIAWVRIEGMERWLNSLMLTDGWDQGEAHWQLTDKGEIDLGINGGLNAISDPVIVPAHLGHWVHIASVYNPIEKEIAHYFNGQPVSRHPLRKVVPVRIGAAEIGNWNPKDHEQNTLRSLNGRIDEFGLFSRAFSDAEIETIYFTGR